MSEQGDSGTSWPYYKQVLTYLTRCHRLANIGSGHHFVFEDLVHEQFPGMEIVSLDRGQPTTRPTSFSYTELDIEDSASKSLVEHAAFDVVTIFEVLEHIDQTDRCLELAHHMLKQDGLLIVASPNLASLYGRIELMLGFQPHVLEVSNKKGPVGMGPFGKMNYAPSGEPIHHMRGITLSALKQLIELNAFAIQETFGYMSGVPFWPKRSFSGLASSVLVIAQPI